MEANWVGYKFDEKDPHRFNTKLIVKNLRELFKQEFPAKEHWKFSIAKDNYSGIRVRILKAPAGSMDPMSVKTKELQGRRFDINDFNSKIATKLDKVGNAYNYDNSDALTDYFDRNYYLQWEVGSFDKSIEIIVK